MLCGEFVKRKEDLKLPVGCEAVPQQLLYRMTTDPILEAENDGCLTEDRDRFAGFPMGRGSWPQKNAPRIHRCHFGAGHGALSDNKTSLDRWASGS